MERYKAFGSKIYSLINHIAKQQGIKCEAEWQREVFLSENGTFLSASKLYYCDDEELKSQFAGKVEMKTMIYYQDRIK